MGKFYIINVRMIVASSILEIIISSSSGLGAFRAIRVIRVTRVLRVTRLIRSLEYMRIIVMVNLRI